MRHGPAMAKAHLSEAFRCAAGYNFIMQNTIYSTRQESYTIYNGPDTDRTPMADFPNSANGVISLDNSALREVDLQAANFNGAAELQFLPLGDPKTGGSMTLNTKTISIQPVTGKWTIN